MLTAIVGSLSFHNEVNHSSTRGDSTRYFSPGNLLGKKYHSSDLKKHEDERNLYYEDSSHLSCLENGSRPCSPWSYCDVNDGTCKCPVNNINQILECNRFGYIDAVINCNCVTYDKRVILQKLDAVLLTVQPKVTIKTRTSMTWCTVHSQPTLTNGMKTAAAHSTEPGLYVASASKVTTHVCTRMI